MEETYVNFPHLLDRNIWSAKCVSVAENIKKEDFKLILRTSEPCFCRNTLYNEGSRKLIYNSLLGKAQYYFCNTSRDEILQFKEKWLLIWGIFTEWFYPDIRRVIYGLYAGACRSTQAICVTERLQADLNSLMESIQRTKIATNGLLMH